MERFKAVEKAMKTKAYSKEGLSAATKQDPKERAKMEACDFLGNMVDELERQIETLEAEGEAIQATMRKGKNQSSKADRMAEIERITERHKWHQQKLELIKRSLENGGVETEQVNDLEESIRYYVTDGMNEDFMEDDEMYDELNLQEEEETYGMNNDNDRVSSQDTQSIQEDTPDPETRSNSIPSVKSKAVTEPPVAAARRPSTQLKSPLPALATLHNPMSNTNGSSSHMKPAAVPTRALGETLKYASAAAAAATSDKMGIAPLPPPPEALPAPTTAASHPPLPSQPSRKSSITASPSAVFSQPANTAQPSSSKTPAPVRPAATHVPDLPSSTQKESPALSQSSTVPSSGNASQQPTAEHLENSRPVQSRSTSVKVAAVPETAEVAKGVNSSPYLIIVHADSSLSSRTIQWGNERHQECRCRRSR